MANLNKFTEDISYVSKLGDNPNTDNGLSANALKGVFDAAGIAIQNFLNDHLIPEVNKKLEKTDLNGYAKTDDVASGFLSAVKDETTGCYYRMADGEKEWFNPPMIPVIAGAPRSAAEGKEYRLTERYNGKPVYARCVEFPDLSDTYTQYGQGYFPDGCKCVSFSGVAKMAMDTITRDYPFPLVHSTDGETVAATAYFDSYSGSVVVKCYSDCSTYSAVFIVKYTKL